MSPVSCRDAVAVELNDPYSFSVFNWLPATKGVLYGCYTVAICQAILLLFGIWSRFKPGDLSIWLISFQNRNPIIWDSEDTLMRLICFYLILMPLNQIWAIGFPWRVARRESDSIDPPQGPAWGLRLLQLQIALIVWVAGTSKLYGRPWVEGDARSYYVRLHEFFPRFPVPGFLFDTPWIVKPMTWLVIVVELIVPILVWFKETRRFALLLVLFFHLASDYSMNLFLFHWLMITGWAAFLTTEDLDAITRLKWPSANK